MHTLELLAPGHDTFSTKPPLPDCRDGDDGGAEDLGKRRKTIKTEAHTRQAADIVITPSSSNHLAKSGDANNVIARS